MDHIHTAETIQPTELIPETPLAPSMRVLFERYEIIEELGKGGAGTVYKVRHLHLGKILALKVLQNKSNDEASVLRFQQEAQASSLLDHPNIVTVYDFGVSAEGQPFIVMDYIEGPSLERLISSDKKTDIQTLIRIFIQVGNALSHAHEQGVVHRDIKPGNIIISTSSDGTLRAILVDFGIAKILPRDDRKFSNLTQTGDIFGTPLYMSPEQCQGHSVDSRADIYALGCVMYETFTGSPPFRGDTSYHTIHMQLCDAPSPFPKELQTRLGRKLEAITLKALAKDPQSRYRFVLDLVSELKRAELISGGALGDLRTMIAIASARMRALPRSRVLTQGALHLFSVAALITAVLLVTLPPRITEAAVQVVKYGSVLVTVQFMTDTKDPSSRIFMDQVQKETPFIDKLERLCADDPDELQIIQKIRRSSKRGEELSMLALKDLDGGLADLIGFRKNTSKLVRMGLQMIVRQWTEAMRLSSELYALSYSKYEVNKNRFDLQQSIFDFCKWAGIGIELTLLTLLIQSWRERRQSINAQTPEP